MSSTRSLLDLPNELIIDILSDANISITDIYTVSCLSKRLNSLALPIYLAAHGIPEPEREMSLYVLDWDLYNIKFPPDLNPFTFFRPDALSGLNISTNISHVRHFKCFFQEPTTKEWRNSFQQAYNLSLAVKRTARFVHRLESVGVAEIYLIWDPYYVRADKTITHVPIPELNEWTESFCRFLNLLLERRCTSLTVQYNASIEPAFRFRSSNPITKTFSNVFQKRRDKQTRTLHWDLERPMHEGKVDPSSIATASLSHLAQESNSIMTLSLHSNALLLPPFVNWTLSLLYSQSSLTCITFAHLTFSKETWTTLLPLIADAVSDRLTKLSFFLKCTNLTAEDLIRFLARLPHLTHLSVDRTFCSRFQGSGTRGKLHLSNLTPPHLSQLQVLKGPTELVFLLLHAQPLSSPSRKNEAPTGFPNLRSLIVYPCTQLQHPTNYSESTSIISSLINQIKNQSRSHEVEYALDLQTEFMITSLESITQYLQSQTSEQKVYHSVWDEINGVEVEELAYRQYGSRIVFRDITRVVLYRLSLHQSPTSLCLWLSLLFPHLTTLVFTCRINAQPEQVSLLDANVVEQLINELATACPTVHTLVVANKTYKLGGN
ncbi:hypothetical protein BYT27DRAFT_7204020 [Phlegmacium glaucopus]|nr:hypothetical protein BYT27DRAFT_7204020 [Phlegmacium glaucopus]